MKHYIIVKYNPEGKRQPGLAAHIQELFLDSLKTEGVHSVSVHTSILNLPNRYDLMICMEMEREALPLFDASEVHTKWKAQYSRYLESKVIFDCD